MADDLMKYAGLGLYGVVIVLVAGVAGGWLNNVGSFMSTGFMVPKTAYTISLSTFIGSLIGVLVGNWAKKALNL